MNIIMLRGLVRERRHWGEFTAKLKEAFPADNIYALDIPGVGAKNEEDSPTKMIDYVHDLRNDLATEKIDLSQKTFILSISMGGMIAKCWIDHFPNDFSGAIFMNTSFKGINPIFKRLRPKAIFSFISLLFNNNTKDRESKIVELVSNKKEYYRKVSTDWYNIATKSPVSRMNAIRQLIAAATYQTNLKGPSDVPLMFLSGAKDRLCHPSCSAELQKKWGGAHHSHKSAGHDLPIDCPEWIIEHLKEIVVR